MTTHYVLHLSDLHIESNAQTNGLLASLRADLLNDLECDRLRAICVSGDVTNRASSEQYKLARAFLQELAKTFHVPHDCIIVAPGNHDVDWTASKASMVRQLARVKGVAGPSIPDPKSEKHCYLIDEAMYRERFLNFSKFHKQVSGYTYSLDYANQYQIRVLEDIGLLFLVLNSAWNLNHVRDDDAGIHADCLNRALNEVMKRSDFKDLKKIAIWHHPIDGAGDDRIRVVTFAHRLAQVGFALALHGHTHNVSTQRIFHELEDEGRVLHVIGAGAIGANHKELPLATPWSYNLVQFHGSRATLIPRHRRSAEGAWEPYPVWQKNARERTTEYSIVFKTAKSALTDGEPFVATMDDLRLHLAQQGFSVEGHRIAVEAHIFDSSGRVLLQRRGEDARDEVDRFEGIGGELGLREDIVAAVLQEVAAKIGPSVKIAVDRLLEVRPITFVERGHDHQSWYVVSYLCRLLSGEPFTANPRLTKELRFFTLQEIEKAPEGTLSGSTVRAFSTYRAKYRYQPYYGPRAGT